VKFKKIVGLTYQKVEERFFLRHPNVLNNGRGSILQSTAYFTPAGNQEDADMHLVFSVLV
jgi:hypothetical protein